MSIHKLALFSALLSVDLITCLALLLEGDCGRETLISEYCVTLLAVHYHCHYHYQLIFSPFQFMPGHQPVRRSMCVRACAYRYTEGLI